MIIIKIFVRLWSVPVRWRRPRWGQGWHRRGRPCHPLPDHCLSFPWFPCWFWPLAIVDADHCHSLDLLLILIIWWELWGFKMGDLSATCEYESVPSLKNNIVRSGCFLHQQIISSTNVWKLRPFTIYIVKDTVKWWHVLRFSGFSYRSANIPFQQFNISTLMVKMTNRPVLLVPSYQGRVGRTQESSRSSAEDLG